MDDYLIEPKLLERTYGPRDHSKLGPEIDRLFTELISGIEQKSVGKLTLPLTKVISYDWRFDYYMARIAPGFKSPEYELRTSSSVMMTDRVFLSIEVAGEEPKNAGVNYPEPSSTSKALPLFAEIKIKDLLKW